MIITNCDKNTDNNNVCLIKPESIHRIKIQLFCLQKKTNILDYSMLDTLIISAY